MGLVTHQTCPGFSESSFLMYCILQSVKAICSLLPYLCIVIGWVG